LGEISGGAIVRDLQKEFSGLKGLSPANLWRMQQFHRAYSAPEFLAQIAREIKTDPVWSQIISTLPLNEITLTQLLPERTSSNSTAPSVAMKILAQAARELATLIPWGHHIVLLPRMKNPKEYLYYLRATSQFGWTRAVLLNQIKADAYSRSLAEDKSHNFPLALPGHLAEQAEETLKSSYNLEFLGISRQMKERELENRLTEQLKDFILELGYGFCFIGRQHRVALGKKEYFIDLLFYHRFLKCLVAIELKIGEFKPEYAGKMDFYLNLLNDNERDTGDNPSIGIILCAEKDDLEVEFALKSKNNPIGVAEYQLKTSLPKELKGKLPSPQELSAAIGLPTKK